MALKDRVREKHQRDVERKAFRNRFKTVAEPAEEVTEEVVTLTQDEVTEDTAIDRDNEIPQDGSMISNNSFGLGNEEPSDT